MKTDKIPVPGTVFENNLKERLMNSSLEDLERQRMVREQLECRDTQQNGSGRIG